ncbi:MAG: phenylacetate--CoA ligase family protein [Candidatus Helarchaeota archaeon]
MSKNDRNSGYYKKSQETKSLSDLKVRQWKDFKWILYHAYRNSKFFKNKLKQANLTPDDINDPKMLAKIPLTNKEEFLIAQAENPPWGNLLLLPINKIGTILVSIINKKPFLIPTSTREASASINISSKALYSAGIRRSDIVDIAVSLAAGGTRGFGLYQSMIMSGCCVVPLGSKGHKSQIQTIKQLGINGIIGDILFFQTLTETCEQEEINPKDLKIDVGCVVGSPLGNEIRNELIDKWDMVLRGLFVHDEVGVVGRECPQMDGLHLSEELFVEILDPNTLEPVNPGDQGEIVVTVPFRDSMPYIRFQLGVKGTITEEICECGRTSPRLINYPRRSD